MKLNRRGFMGIVGAAAAAAAAPEVKAAPAAEPTPSAIDAALDTDGWPPTRIYWYGPAWVEVDGEVSDGT